MRFDTHSILAITTEYGQQSGLKEIGPLPFFIHELEYIDRFKEEEDDLKVEITIRPYTFGELFNPSQPVVIHILDYQDVQTELKKQHLIIKSP